MVPAQRGALRNVMSAHAADSLRSLVRAPTAREYLALGDLINTQAVDRAARAYHRMARAGSVSLDAVLGALLDSERVVRVLTAAGEADSHARMLTATLHGLGCRILLLELELDDAPASERLPSRERPMPVVADSAAWRPILLPILRSPWASYGEDLLALVNEIGDRAAVDLIERFRDLSQEQQARRERDLVAAEVRRAVALTGLTQREFATHIGTSASRLSTYANGRVTPSATMLVRIRRTARAVAGVDPGLTRWRPGAPDNVRPQDARPAM